MADLRAHGPSVNADVLDFAEQQRRNALYVLGILLRAYVPKNTNDWREMEDALKVLASRPAGVTVVYGSSEPRQPCTVCAKPLSEHGSYPTCATHPYTADGTCQHVLGAACVGAECNGGCVRASRATGDAS